MISLWILALVSLLSLGLAHRVTINLKLVKFQKDRLKCFYAAKAAINNAIGVLENDVSNRQGVPTTLNQIWSLGYNVTIGDAEYILRDVEVGDATFTVQSTQDLYHGVTEVVVESSYCMIDEDRKININSASKDLLRVLFEILELSDPDVLAQAITYWRGDDPETVDPYYGSEEVPYEAPKAPFHAIEELSLVKGFRGDWDLISKCEYYLSVFCDAASININTASSLVLKAIFVSLGADTGFADRLVNNVINYRNGTDGQPGTADDVPITNVVIKEVLKNGLVGNEIDWVDDRGFPFTARSQWFRIEAIATMVRGTMQKKIDAVVSAQENYRIVYWHEE